MLVPEQGNPASSDIFVKKFAHLSLSLLWELMSGIVESGRGADDTQHSLGRGGGFLGLDMHLLRMKTELTV
jgi:hypothetical protein